MFWMLPFEFQVLKIPVGILELRSCTVCMGKKKGGCERKGQEQVSHPFALCRYGLPPVEVTGLDGLE